MMARRSASGARIFADSASSCFATAGFARRAVSRAAHSGDVAPLGPVAVGADAPERAAGVPCTWMALGAAALVWLVFLGPRFWRSTPEAVNEAADLDANRP